MSMYSMMMSTFHRTVKNMFTKHLFTTNVVTCSCLLGIGDAISQKFEHRTLGNPNEKFTMDWKRTGRMCSVGLMLGPMGHFWYKILDKFVTGASTTTVFKKILADQVLAGPFFCVTFLFGMSVLEGHGAKGGIEEIKEKFIPIYIMDWFVWPPAQFINFKYLPPQARMMYVSFITLIWDCILSYIKHQGFHLQKLPSTESAESLSSSNKVNLNGKKDG